MKRFAKIVQCDHRGQIVIPKDVRRELHIEEGTGFYMYIIQEEGILLKTIPTKELGEHEHVIKEIELHAGKIDVKKKNLDSSIQNYKKRANGSIQEVT